jgi:hypothetical protein
MCPTDFFSFIIIIIIILLGFENSPKTKHCSTFYFILFFGDEVSPFWKMNNVSQISFFEKNKIANFSFKTLP